MSGIYLHIPFCKQACHYCNFHFSTSLNTYDDVVEAICKEVEQRVDYLPSRNIETIYFGGGTPSVLKPEDLDRILQSIHHHYQVSAAAEVTLEANPDDIDQAKLKAWKEAGINRLSIGVQSFFEDDLKWMNRAHNAEQAEQSIRWAQEAGFSNITADLIYGLPHGHWKENIAKMVSLGVPHISCYALMVEERTALHHFVKVGKAILPPDEKAEEDYAVLCQTLTDAGYEHYEISNFAKAEYRSKHNGSYWKGIPYLGIGPSAHSFDGKNRRWNLSSNKLYSDALKNGGSYSEEEILTSEDRYNEYVMTGLRKKEGITLKEIESIGGPFKQYFLDNSSALISNGKIRAIEGSYVIPEEEWFRADTIIADLFWVD